MKNQLGKSFELNDMAFAIALRRREIMSANGRKFTGEGGNSVLLGDITDIFNGRKVRGILEASNQLGQKVYVLLKPANIRAMRDWATVWLEAHTKKGR